MSEEQDETGADAPVEAEDDGLSDLREANKVLLQDLESKHGDLKLYRAPKFLGGGLIAVATPKRTAYHKFVTDIRNEKQSAPIVSEALALASVVYPDRETLKQYFESKPGLALILSAFAQRLATGETEDLGKG